MGQNFKLKVENEFVIIEFDQPESKANVLSAASLMELQEIIMQLTSKQILRGVCLVSAKPDIFIAGADIREIEKITQPSEGISKAQAGQRILNDWEKLPVPTIALINGACLGGGLELALACDYRLASFGDKVKIGLPEVKLGIIPGFGGTKRLSRLVGLRKALDMILSGDPVSGSDALKIGLVEGLVSQNKLIEEGIIFLRAKGKKRSSYKPRLKGFMDTFLDKTFIGRSVLRDQSRKNVLKNTKGHYPAPIKALNVVIDNYSSSLEKSLEREAKCFGELVVTPVCKNLISVFCLVEKYKKVKWAQATSRPIHKCGILGAGVMGGGIAQLFSYYGLPVRMKDLNYEALGRGLKQAKEVYDYAVKKRKLKPGQAQAGLSLISATVDYAGFSNADLIVEAVVEDMRIKKAVFTEINSIASPSAILATNTSCLPVAMMSVAVERKERVVGMHFFNPVHRMPLIEVIRTPHTSDETVATMVEFCRRIGKTVIVVKDSYGFLINRILLPYLNEAGFILDEGASFEHIDDICLKFGMPMGPFTLVDEIGLDVGYKVATVLEENYGSRMKVAEILKKAHLQKWFGKKAGKGFYIHGPKGKTPNKEIYNFVSGRKGMLMSDEKILQRMLYRMINEAAMCLQEKVCVESSDVDIGMIMGTGFPFFRAGLLRYADSVGASNIVKSLLDFEKETKQGRFNPCSYLIEMGEKKKKFYQ